MSVTYFLNHKPGKSRKKKDPAGRFLLHALINDEYYWTIEWQHEPDGKEVRVTAFYTGLLDAGVREACSKMYEADIKTLREELGSLAYFIERAVNGFMSYLLWISPDPAQRELPWCISLS